MSIEKRKNGKYWVRLPNEERTSLGLFDSYEDAAKAEREGIKKMSTSAPGMTLRQWLEKWLDTRELDGVRSIKGERNAAKTHVLTAPFIDWPMTLIHEDDIERWIDKLRAKKTANRWCEARPIAIKTVREVIGLLRRCFDDAVMKPVVTGVGQNPVTKPSNKFRKDVLKRKGSRGPKKWTYLDFDEQEKFTKLKNVPEEHLLIMRIAMRAGFRKGEQFNLELVDVKLDGADDPHFEVRFGSKGMPPKNGQPRQVGMDQVLEADVRRWLELLPSWCPPEKNEHRLLFPTRTGCRVAENKTLLIVPDPNWRPTLRSERLEKLQFIVKAKEPVTARMIHDRFWPQTSWLANNGKPARWLLHKLERAGLVERLDDCGGIAYKPTAAAHKAVKSSGGKRKSIDLFKVYLKAAGIERRFRWHDLRHTCATSLISGIWSRRWSLREVQEHLGHLSAQSTQIYAHLADSAYKAAVRETGATVKPERRRQSVVPTTTTQLLKELAATIGNPLAPAAGLEPATRRLTAPSNAEQKPIVAHEIGSEVGSNAHAAGFAKRARAALAALDAGDPFANAMTLSLLEELMEHGAAAEPETKKRASG